MNAQEKMAYAIQSLLLKKKIEDISVKDICMAADVSRQTFYKFFKDKYDLAFWIYKNEADRICEEYVHNHDYHNMLVNILKIYKSNVGYYQKLLLSTDVQNSFFNQYISYSVDLSIDMIGRSNMDPFKRRVLRMFSSGVAVEIRNWVLSGTKEDCDSFAHLIEESLPVILREGFRYDG